VDFEQFAETVPQVGMYWVSANQTGDGSRQNRTDSSEPDQWIAKCARTAADLMVDDSPKPTSRSTARAARLGRPFDTVHVASERRCARP
jgi:hypothetical protein